MDATGDGASIDLETLEDRVDDRRRAVCDKLFLQCHDVYHERFGTDEVDARVGCLLLAEQLPVVDGPVRTGASVDCYESRLADLEDGGSCSAIFGEGGCTGPAIRPAGAFNTCGEDVSLCNRATAFGLHAGGAAYGRSAVFVDVDGDGWDDIWQSDSGTARDDHDNRSRLFRNVNGRFFEELDVGFSDASLRGNWSTLFADFDNDGDRDVIHASAGYDGVGYLHMYRNAMRSVGRFIDVRAASGIGEDERAWWSLTAADFDNDGLLDIAATALSDWFAEDGGEQAYEAAVHIYRNLGDLRFENVSGALGIGPAFGDIKNPLWLDYDEDGYSDLLVISNSHDQLTEDPNRDVDDGTGLYRNMEGERFERVTWMDDDLFAGFVTTTLDANMDGHVDVWLGRWDRGDVLLLNDGAGRFDRVDDIPGVDHDPVFQNTMGIFAGDIDSDGLPDIVIGTGSPEAAKPPLLYLSELVDGKLRWHDASVDLVAGHGSARHHGVSASDFDHDGDRDLFFNIGGFAAYPDDQSELSALYVNQMTTESPTVSVLLVGTVSNRDAIGARVRLDSELVSYGRVSGGTGFMSQDSLWLTLPMGNATEAILTVDWPAGGTSRHRVSTNTRVTILEPTR